MAQQVINIGSAPNDGTGDPLRTAFDKCNDNFTELYSGGGGTGSVSSVSVVAANGVSGTVSNPTTTPAITLTLGAITPATVNGITMLGASSPQLTVIGTSAVQGNNTGDQNLFSKIAVAGEADVVADSPTDTLTLVAGANVILTTNAANDEITISSTGGGGGGAPVNADYLVRTANASLTAERVVTDSTSITANWSTAGQVAFERAALNGDVTALANSNTTAIAAGVVNTTKLGGDITAAGKALLDDADAAAQRTTLGLGSLATLSTVPYSSVDNIVTSRILGRSSSGTGAAETLTVSNVLDLATSTQGALLYRGSAQWFGLAPGTSGRVLLTNGAGADPSWGQVSLSAGVTGDLPLSNLAQASTGSILLGRGAGAGAGDFQEITLGTNLSMSGTVLNASGGSGGGNVSGPASPITDNALVRWDLTNTQIQNSGVILSDTQEMSGLKSVTFNTAGGAAGLAKLVWDTTNQTLDLGIGSGSVNALVGVDSHVLGRNTTGTLVTRGQVVRVNGASSGNLTIALAQGNTDPNTSNTIGIAAEDIANSQTGMVITNGLLRDLNTSSFAAGDLLYISPTTPGLLVNTIPAAPNHAVRMGYVVSAHPSNGIVYVAVNNGYELNELHDVNYPTTPATNDFLVYAANRWENQTPATARASMGLGSLATQSGTFSGTSSGTNTGDQTITLTGDVTGTGTGSFATTIGANKVQYSMIQQAAGLTVVGNGGSTTANVGSITGTAGQVLRVDAGGTALAFGALSLSTAASITGTLGVANGGTGITSLGTGVATWLGTPSSANLAAAITDETGSGALVFATSPTLTTPILGTPQSGTLTSCTGLPAAGTTFAATSRIHGRATAGAGAGEELTLTQVLDLVGSAAQGDILYRGASGWTRLGAGTSGQYLKTQGAAADPVWATVSASGGGSTNVWIPAAQWIPRTTTGCGINSLEASTNKVNYDVLEFDPVTNEFAQCAVVLPNNWNAGTVTAKFHWTAASGSGTVIWGLSGRAYADNNAIDQATGTAQTVTDTLLTAAYEHITSSTSAITLAGSPAAGQMVIFQLYRDAAVDTLGSDAQFLGVEITYTSI